MSSNDVYIVVITWLSSWDPVPMDLYGAGNLEQVRDESIRRLEGGALPVLAERRLAALFGGTAERFTTQLSVSEFALARSMGLRPVSQVMGSCMYHARFALDRVGPAVTTKPGTTTRMPAPAEAWNVSRKTALWRMRAEAKSCAADAVVGVDFRQTQEHLEGRFDATIECVATGTAVVHGSAVTGGTGPVMTNLSAQDYWKLLQQGYRAAGIVAYTAVVGCKPSVQLHQAESSIATTGAAARSWEIPEFTEGLRFVHKIAFDEMRAQAQQLGAHGIVGVTAERVQHVGEVRNSTYKNLTLAVHAVGTAIVRGGTPPAAGHSLTMTPVRHLDKKGGTDS
jgi:uncharacterized protein YbjQ (UPF0145 family)